MQTTDPEPALPETIAPETTIDTNQAQQPQEVGGTLGLDPTRYGDWEKNGRCIDF